MTRIANQFRNPATAATYDWPINHQEEEENGLGTPITQSATTSGTAFVRQQGEESPLKLVFRGTILEQAQHDAFITWVRLCRDQTIIFRDFQSDEYEVLITSFRPKRVRVAHNPRGGTENPLHKYEYTIEMDVIAALSGPWA